LTKRDSFQFYKLVITCTFVNVISHVTNKTALNLPTKQKIKYLILVDCIFTYENYPINIAYHQYGVGSGPAL